MKETKSQCKLLKFLAITNILSLLAGSSTFLGYFAPAIIQDGGSIDALYITQFLVPQLLVFAKVSQPNPV